MDQNVNYLIVMEFLQIQPIFYCFGVYKTFSSACSSHGKCLAHDTCNCTTGYYGSKCDNFNCFGLNKTDANVCSAHGTCTDIDKCRCDSTYGGSRCHLTSKNVCYGYNALHSKSCSGSDKSECVGANNCTCFPGYSSKDCSYWECFGKNNTDTTGCSGRGTCTGFQRQQCEGISSFASTIKSNLVFTILIGLLMLFGILIEQQKKKHKAQQYKMSRLIMFMVGVYVGARLTYKYDFNKIADCGRKEILKDEEFKKFMNKMKKLEKQMQRSNQYNNDDE
eukprot:gene902-9813_t